MNKREKLLNKKERLQERLSKEEQREREILSRRGWGYGMRHSKIGFSTRKSDELKEKISIVEMELKETTAIDSD